MSDIINTEMALYQETFERYEVKFLLNDKQLKIMQNYVDAYMMPDIFGPSTIYNIYFDTPDFSLIRQAMLGENYKEKLRLRCYNRPDIDSLAFIEMKRKARGLVYKRRVVMKYGDALDYMLHGKEPVLCDTGFRVENERQKQVLREIDWFRKSHSPLVPAADIISERVAFIGKDNQEFRLTFDKNTKFRTDDFDLRNGPQGILILEPGMTIMELKLMQPVPYELARIMSDAGIMRTNYSKYGKAYEYCLTNKLLGCDKGGNEKVPA